MTSLKDFINPVVSHLIDKDQGLKHILDHTLDPTEKERVFTSLKKFGSKLLRWDQLAIEAARPEKLPRIEKYDPVGNRIEKIVLPLETQTIRREVVEAGIWENKSEVEKLAKVYLLSQIGEAGITCPLACTDGLIKVILAHGSDYLKNEIVPLLKSTEYPLSGAQFITEQTGGSDVGATLASARVESDGTWRIKGEKWYCSATDEFFLLTARPEGAPDGTEGLAIFFVPRMIKKDGKDQPNNLSIKRLKDKLGTQSLPTAEIDFEDSKAYLIGKKEEGFKNLMTYVINTSRVHNAANTLGLYHRAFAEALNYAEQREAFGDCIINYPLIQESLVCILANLTAKRTLFFNMLQQIDEKGFVPHDREQRLWIRFLINLMKYSTAVNAVEQIKQAILVFGANGIIQDFSIMPRLLRDSLIIETWEGTHNTLCLQILRDSARFDFFGRFNKEVQELLTHWPDDVLSESRVLYQKACEHLQALLTKDHLQDQTWLQTHARRIVDQFSNLLEVGNLIKQGVVQKNHSVLALASYLTHVHYSDGFKNPVLSNLAKMGLDLVRENSIKIDLKKY